LTLKSRLGVAEGHWIWYHSVDRIQVAICVPLTGSILYRFRKKAYILAETRQFFIPPVFYFHDPLEPLRLFAQNFSTNFPSPWVIRRCKILPKSSSLC